MNSARNLHSRITRLEQTLGALRCHCRNSADLAWPGHQPDSDCPSCGGERLIYLLPHHPRGAETLIRQALPIIEKAFSTEQRADLSTLTDPELRQLENALQAVEQTPPLQNRASPKTKPKR